MSKSDDYRIISEFMGIVAESCNPYEGAQAVMEKALPELIENRNLDTNNLPNWVAEQLPEHFVCGICGKARFGIAATYDAESGECCPEHFTEN